MIKETFVPIKKMDAAKQIVMGEVYIPYVPDSQGDFMTPDEIERIAHNFLRNRRVFKVDTEHNLVENGSVVVESFIARPGDPDFTPGAWVVGTHIPDKTVWAKVESGEINGYSMYGTGVRKETIVEIEIPDDGIVKGETIAAGDGHSHTFFLEFDDAGSLINGYTDEVNGHKHVIKSGTITEQANGHAHRYSMTDALAKLLNKEGTFAK
jgi:hypothetical protein